MSEAEDNRNQHERPPDPAGTRRKVDPESLVPARREPLLDAAIESTAVEEDRAHTAEGGHDFLPERVAHESLGPVKPTMEPPHAPRFQFLLGALVALGFAAVVTVVAVAISGPGPNGPSGPRWSSWQPTGDGGAVTEQIAKHVGHEYRLASGHQLVLVTGGPPEVAGLPLTFVMQRAASQGGDLTEVGGKGALYRLCGLGPKCAIAEGKPSKERGLLLRREALELALYTFRYADVDNVAVLFPPALAKNPSKTPDPSLALFFRRQDVDPELSQPLRATLARTAPRPETVTKSPDANFVNRLTLLRQFQYTLSPANQDARAYLVLRQIS